MMSYDPRIKFIETLFKRKPLCLVYFKISSTVWLQPAKSSALISTYYQKKKGTALYKKKN